MSGKRKFTVPRYPGVHSYQVERVLTWHVAMEAQVEQGGAGGLEHEAGRVMRLGGVVAEVLELEMDASELTDPGEANRDTNN